MRRLLRRFVDDLRSGENLDLYIIVGAALTLSIWSFFGAPDPQIILSTTLAVLGLLAMGLLINRDRLERLLRLQGRPAREVLLTEFPDVTDELEGARDIWISGQNLRRTVITYSSLLGMKLEKGSHIRVLLVDPEGTAPQLAAKRLTRSPETSMYREEIRLSLQDVHSLAVRAKKGGRLELRILDYVPPFGMFILDPNSPKGRALVEVYAYKGRGDMPKFYLTDADDPTWFEFFREQFEILWNDSTDWHVH